MPTSHKMFHAWYVKYARTYSYLVGTEKSRMFAAWQEQQTEVEGLNSLVEQLQRQLNRALR